MINRVMSFVPYVLLVFNTILFFINSYLHSPLAFMHLGLIFMAVFEIEVLRKANGAKNGKK